MTLTDAQDIWEYWLSSPPEHEMIAMFATVYTTWKPGGKPMTEEDARVEHRKSLEQRWNAGALNVKQILAVTGGVIEGPQR